MGTSFVVIANFESESLGLPGMPLAVVEYPMGGVSREEAISRADRVFDDIVGALTLGEASP